jgi:hypothetical protein
MSKLRPEAHNTLRTIWGVRPNVDWAHDPLDPGDYACKIEVCVEFYDGEKMAYVAGLDENGQSVRIDLDVQGWRDLAEVAMEVHERMAKAMREDLAG